MLILCCTEKPKCLKRLKLSNCSSLVRNTHFHFEIPPSARKHLNMKKLNKCSAFKCLKYTEWISFSRDIAVRAQVNHHSQFLVNLLDFKYIIVLIFLYPVIYRGTQQSFKFMQMTHCEQVFLTYMWAREKTRFKSQISENELNADYEITAISAQTVFSYPVIISVGCVTTHFL